MTSRIDFRVVVASAIVTVMVLIPRPSAAFAADTWLEIKAPHVTVLANGGTADARTLA